MGIETEVSTPPLIRQILSHSMGTESFFVSSYLETLCCYGVINVINVKIKKTSTFTYSNTTDFNFIIYSSKNHFNIIKSVGL
jgi:hypothetical protein